jgi:hypothetical protein
MAMNSQAIRIDPFFCAIAIICWAFICAAIGGKIGTIKGRPEAGFLWGFLLGPLGWLIVFGGPDLGTKCPFCHGSIDDGVSKCRHCGSDLTDKSKSESVAK